MHKPIIALTLIILSVLYISGSRLRLPVWDIESANYRASMKGSIMKTTL